MLSSWKDIPLDSAFAAIWLLLSALMKTIARGFFVSLCLRLFKLASCALKVRNAVSPSSPSEPTSVSPGVTAGFLQNHF